MQSLPGIRPGAGKRQKVWLTKNQFDDCQHRPRLWRQQLATAVDHFSLIASGGKTVKKAATDLTNDLLAANAENLKLANAETRKATGARCIRYRSDKKG